jgi:hydroxyethylthiazole kinase-like uncharacterized protein yjeF
MGFMLPDERPVPAVITAQMREIGRGMIEDFYIELVQMMENAGRNLAGLAGALYSPRTIVVLAGPGGNGGGGLVAASHRRNRGADVSVVLGAAGLAPVPARQLDIIQRMGIPVLDQPVVADLVIDALLGYGLRGDPAPRFAELITWANGQPAPVLALDTPSGLGRQPAATRICPYASSRSRPAAVFIVTERPWVSRRTDTTVAAVRMPMPSSSRTSSIVAESSGSWSGASRSSASAMLTRVPSRANSCASSRLTAFRRSPASTPAAR